jgi:hypothetical protein
MFEPDTKERNAFLDELKKDLKGKTAQGAFGNELHWTNDSSRMKLVYDNTAVLNSVNLNYNPLTDYCTDIYMEYHSLPYYFKIQPLKSILDKIVFYFDFTRIKTRDRNFNNNFNIECDSEIYIKNILTPSVIDSINRLNNKLNLIVIAKTENSIRIRAKSFIVDKYLMLQYIQTADTIFQAFKT